MNNSFLMKIKLQSDIFSEHSIFEFIISGSLRTLAVSCEKGDLTLVTGLPVCCVLPCRLRSSLSFFAIDISDCLYWFWFFWFDGCWLLLFDHREEKDDSIHFFFYLVNSRHLHNDEKWRYKSRLLVQIRACIEWKTINRSAQIIYWLIDMVSLWLYAPFNCACKRTE